MAGLGEILERSRLERGASLEEAERNTHIARRFLQALEREDYSVFSSPVFARGFLRNYCIYLGLDPNEVLAYWPQSPTAPPPPPEPPSETARDEFEQRARPLRERSRPRPATSYDPREMPGPLTRRLQPQMEPGSTIFPLAAAVAIVVIFGIALFGISRVEGKSGAVSRGAAPASTQAAGGTAAQPKPTRQPPALPAGTMPDLIGADVTNAQQQLLSRGVTPLVIGVISANRADRPNSVLRQQPAVGRALTTNSTVTLTIAILTASQSVQPSATSPARLPTGTPLPTPRAP